MKRWMTSLGFALAMAIGGASPLAADCAPGNYPVGNSCCVVLGGGGALSCHDGACWFCIGDCVDPQIFCPE